MTAARILVVLGVLLIVVSLVAGYVRFQGLDTDTVEESAGELIADKEIRDQVAASLVDELYTKVDIASVLEENLPDEQKGLAGPAAAGLRELSDRAAVRMLERPRVQALWVDAVTRAHRQLINVLDDSDEALLSTEGGAIYLDLQPLMIQLGERVAVFGEVATRLGPDAGRIEIMEANELETAQDLTKLLKFLGTWLWILPVALWAAALYLARGRRRSILRLIALGSILAGFIVLVLRRLGGETLIEELVASTSAEPAAQNAWDILTSLLRDGGLTLVGLGVIMLFVVWLIGPSTSGVASRRGLAPYLARPEIAYGAAGGLFLLLLWWSPTVQTTRVPLILAAAITLALGVELLRRQTAREVTDPGAPDLGGSIRRSLGRARGSSSAEDRVATLERLRRLHAEGAVTDEEYAAEKARLMGQ